MNLETTQLLSLATKAVTTALGIVQSIIVIRLLGPTGWGLVGLVMSIGGLIGVTQHLGVVDGAIREIAVRRRKDEVSKIFWVSNMVRQAVTIPLSVALFTLAAAIAVTVYDKPAIIPFIQLFAASLVLQGLQDVFGATLTGMKKFGLLYIVQILTAALNIIIFGYLTWHYGVGGFFWAIILTTAIMVAMYLIILSRELRGYLRWPNREDIRRYARSVMRVGAYMYIARIFFVLWQRLPLLVLGGVLAAHDLGYFNVSLTFGSKLTIIAMALAEVNLAWMSSLFVERPSEFARVTVRNMQRVLVLLLLITLMLVFFTPEIIRYALGPEFLPAQELVLIMTLAFFLYSLLDLGTSSIFVAADQPYLRAGIYGLMTALTGLAVAGIYALRPNPLLASGGALLGALAGYGALLFIARHRFNIKLLSLRLAWLLISLGTSVSWLLTAPDLFKRTAIFLVIFGFTLYEIRHSKLLPRVTRAGLKYKVLCFAGAFYDAPIWTNRQHVMSRIAQKHPVLYVEPRVWIFRFLLDHWRRPFKIIGLVMRIIGWQKSADDLYVKAQWNLIPGSREYKWISRINHWLNRWNVLLTAKVLGFGDAVIWLYDTEAAEFLNAFQKAKVVYDCVDDHAVQAGPNRNSDRVREEEQSILQRANLVTVTSNHLYNQKKVLNKNVHLVEQGADVRLFADPDDSVLAWPAGRKTLGSFKKQGPIIGSVGTLDSYKYDFDLIEQIASSNPEWQFVFVGEPTVERGQAVLERVATRPNVHILGAVPRDLVPNYVRQFDICIIPYRDNEYNRSSFPLKFWEFMATGKQIVVSGLPELKKYSDLIGYAHSVIQFAAEIRKALVTPKLGRERRMALAEKHAWESRVAALLKLMKN